MCLYVIILDANAVFCFLFNCHSFLGSSFCQRESGTLHFQVVLVMNSDVEDKNKISRSRTLTPSFLSVCFFVLYCVSHFLKNIGREILMLVVYLVARPIVSPHLGILLAVFENKITKKNIRLLVSCTSLCRIMETSRLCLFHAYQVYCWCSSIFYSDNYSKPVTICI